MDDKTKVQLCKKLIREFNDYLDGEDTANWMSLVWSLDVVLNFEEEQHGYKVDECNHTDCPYRTEPMTNADRIRAMRDEELSEFLCSILSKDRDGCSGCVAEDYCYQGHTGMIDYLMEEAT